MAEYKTSNELVNYLKTQNYELVTNGCISKLIINDIVFEFNIETNKYAVRKGKQLIAVGRNTTFDLTKPENHCIVMLLLKLIKKGYAFSSITLEKSWQTGHSPIFLDLMLHDNATESVFMVEVKKYDEYLRYTNPENESKVKQLCSYAMQEQTTKIASFYTYDFDNHKDLFSNIFCSELRSQSVNSDDFYDRWNKVFDETDYIGDNPIFNIKKSIKTYQTLKKISESDTKSLFQQFLTILRLNSISDKPTAFMKMINLFLAKLADEITENKIFTIKDKYDNSFSFNGMKFQYIDDEKPESFMKRLNELYKEGMQRYMRKTIIDYSDEELLSVIQVPQNEQLMKIFDDLRLKKNINFSFIDVFDEATFLENFEVVKDIVRLIENYQLKYETKHQFLGDFFEDLLNTSLKQEAGQFFTPYPIVDFMVKSLDIKECIERYLTNGNVDFIPTVIDYACGAGHFLISAMTEIQNILNDIDENNLTREQQRRLKAHKDNPYLWADNKKIVGIEKDYRLAKTTKIASFLNGDGEAEIITGDGVNKFNCNEYKQTILYTESNKNEIFDYVVANPPYSVDGFMLNFRKNSIDKNSNTFSLLQSDLNIKDSAIEIFFVERTEQLLKQNGVATIILPQSVLSNEKYEKMRKFIFDNFRIISMLLTADITFSGTTTSPVILFLRKEKMENLDYNVLIHKSPKYSNPNASKQKNRETKFLGYEFSNNRNKSGIKIINNSILSKLIDITNEFIVKSNTKIPINLSEYSEIRPLSEIILNSKNNYCGDIYPKRIFVSNGNPLSDYCKINEWTERGFEQSEIPKQYLEISDLNDQTPKKKKKTTRFCKMGDILLSSLCPTKSKIVIAKDCFMLSPAIHVLSDFENNEIRDKVFNALREDITLNQMNSLLDGFKITYAKISESNLINNVFISI